MYLISRRSVSALEENSKIQDQILIKLFFLPQSTDAK